MSRVGSGYSERWHGWGDKRDERTENPEERARKRGVPLIPPRKPPRPVHDPVVAVCGACGIEMRRVMHYSCSRSDCPCFPQVRC